MTKTDTDEAVFVGVDIAKDRFDFAARPSGETGHGGVNSRAEPDDYAIRASSEPTRSGISLHFLFS